MSNPVLTARGRYGFAIKVGDPDLIADTARDLAAEKLAAYIEKVVSSAPPLTADQRSRLAALLTNEAA